MDWGAIDEPYERFGEYSRASAIIKEINREHDRPFFAALGFYLPHLPWYYPKKILQLLTQLIIWKIFKITIIRLNFLLQKMV